jgi:hypothetical protein
VITFDPGRADKPPHVRRNRCVHFEANSLVGRDRTDEFGAVPHLNRLCVGATALPAESNIWTVNCDMESNEKNCAFFPGGGQLIKPRIVTICDGRVMTRALTRRTLSNDTLKRSATRYVAGRTSRCCEPLPMKSG